MNRRRSFCWSVIIGIAAAPFCTHALLLANQANQVIANATVSSDHQFALLVGVSEYVVPEWNTLRAPANDVGLMKDLLTGSYHFVNDDAHLVTLVGRQATRKAIVDGFRSQLIANAKKFPDSTLVFYFSGHGALTTDGLHETLVPSDGRTPGVFDIYDDDLSDLFDELLQYATKDTRIVFIMDSCHSGTIVKGIDETIHSKEIPPDPRPQPKRPSSTRSQGGLISKDLGTGVLVRNEAFVAIASSYSYESSYEDCLADKVGGFALPKCQQSASGKYKPYSLFTYYLTNVLKLSPYITYRQALDEVSSVVSRRATQHPNVEGDAGRSVFGSAASREDPFFSILGPITNKKFTVNGGAIEGLEEGAYLAIYKPSIIKLKGEVGKICNARVLKPDDFQATAEITGDPNVQIPPDAKVVLVTPYFGGRRLKVKLDANQTGTPLTAADKQFLDRVEASLKDNLMIEVVKGEGSWDVGVQKVSIETGQGRCRQTDSGDEFWVRELWAQAPAPSFQVVTPDQNGSLYGCHVLVTDPDGTSLVDAVLSMRFRQQSVRAISNARSPLNGKVRIGIIKVTTELGSDGKPKITAEDALSANDLHSLPQGQRLKLRVYNDGDQDLKVVVIDIATSGGIALMTPNGVGVTVPARQSFTTHQVFKSGGTTGLETIKLVAYTNDSNRPDPNFRILEQKGFIALDSKDISSPLGWLFAQAAGGMAKDLPLDSSLDTDSWTVTSVEAYLQ